MVAKNTNVATIAALSIALGLGVISMAGTNPSSIAQKQLEEAANPASAAVPGAPEVRQLPAPVTAPAKARAAGTIAYDNGVATALPNVTSHSWGNQFNTQNSDPVFASGSVSKLTFFMDAGAGTDNVFASVFGPVAGTAAPVLTSPSVPLNGGPGAWNTHTFTTPIAYTGASFLAGIWYFGDTIALGAGTTNGQGHHGMHINDIAGTGFVSLGTLNALMRASGNIVPVELMSFSAE